MKNERIRKNLNALEHHWQQLKSTSIQSLFDQDGDRFNEFSVEFEDLIFDFSKQHLDQSALSALSLLAEDGQIETSRDAMFSGQKINVTENRAVLHTALRNQSGEVVNVDGDNVMLHVTSVLNSMAEFCDAVRSGEYEVSGGRITDVVNIGIGGSDLGPKMVTRALNPYCDGPRVRFVSNVDGADISDTLQSVDLSTTLFIVVSKTFTTQETMANAEYALKRMKALVGDQVGSHFCAVSSNVDATRAFGISDENTFELWDWVGGRYSVWGAVGLSVMLAIGPDAFQEFLSGADAADQHFKDAETTKNIPVLMAMLGIWNRNVCGCTAQAILPYDNRLADFPRWLQQLEMESSGKSVSVEGEALEYATSPVIFGEPGTNGQHAFYQMLHQGTDVVLCDFLVAAQGYETDLASQHELLLANCLAQSQALMTGQSLEQADGDPHRVFAGNRPSNTFLYRKLDPRTLGMIMAFYEHKVFVQACVWNINAFDQFGVELGKKLAKDVEQAISKKDTSGLINSSTKGLLSKAFDFPK